MPSSIHRIMHRMETRIASKHYDTSAIERMAKIREPVQRKFDKLHDAKVRYGSRPNTNATGQHRTKTTSSEHRGIS